MNKLIQRCYALHVTDVANAIQDLVRYECLYGMSNTIIHNQLKLLVAWEEFKLEFFKGLPYVHKVIKIN